MAPDCNILHPRIHRTLGPGHRAGCCVERAVYCRVEYSGVNHLTIPLLAALILLLTTKREVGWKESVIKLRSNKRHETLGRMCSSVDRNLIHISKEYHSFASDKISCINTDFPVILEPEMGQWIG